MHVREYNHRVIHPSLSILTCHLLCTRVTCLALSAVKIHFCFRQLYIDGVRVLFYNVTALVASQSPLGVVCRASTVVYVVPMFTIVVRYDNKQSILTDIFLVGDNICMLGITTVAASTDPDSRNFDMQSLMTLYVISDGTAFCFDLSALTYLLDLRSPHCTLQTPVVSLPALDSEFGIEHCLQQLLFSSQKLLLRYS